MFEEALRQLLTFYDNYRFVMKMTEQESKDKTMEVYYDFYEWLNEGGKEQAESKKTLVANKDVASIPVENTVTKKEPEKKSNYKGKRSKFEMWFKELEIGTKFTIEDFFKDNPKFKPDIRGKERLTKYISKLISERKLLQHSSERFEKIGG